jgi:hypothetical protein
MAGGASDFATSAVAALAMKERFFRDNPGSLSMSKYYEIMDKYVMLN